MSARGFKVLSHPLRRGWPRSPRPSGRKLVLALVAATGLALPLIGIADALGARQTEQRSIRVLDVVATLLRMKTTTGADGALSDDRWIARRTRIDMPGRAKPLVAVVHRDLGPLPSRVEPIDLGARGAMPIARSDGVLPAREPFEAGLTGHDLPRGPVIDAVWTAAPAGDFERIVNDRSLPDAVVAAALAQSPVLGDGRIGRIRPGGLVGCAILVVALVGLSPAREIRRRELEAAATRDDEIAEVDTGSRRWAVSVKRPAASSASPQCRAT